MHIDYPSVKRILRRERDRVDEKIELSPFLANSIKYRLRLPGNADIQRHEDRRFELARERLHMFLCLFIEIGDGEVGSQGAERLGAAPGDRLLVGDADDQAFAPFEGTLVSG